MSLLDFINSLITFLSTPTSIFKLFFIVLLAVYSIYAVSLLLQVRVLNKVINLISFSPIFTSLAFLHLLLTLTLLLYAIFIL